MATDRKKSSCSFKEPGQQDDQDEENKLLNLGEMKVCFSKPPHPDYPTPSKMNRYRSEGGLHGVGWLRKTNFEFREIQRL